LGSFVTNAVVAHVGVIRALLRRVAKRYVGFGKASVQARPSLR